MGLMGKRLRDKSCFFSDSLAPVFDLMAVEAEEEAALESLGAKATWLIGLRTERLREGNGGIFARS